MRNIVFSCLIDIILFILKYPYDIPSVAWESSVAKWNIPQLAHSANITAPTAQYHFWRKPKISLSPCENITADVVVATATIFAQNVGGDAIHNTTAFSLVRFSRW